MIDDKALAYCWRILDKMQVGQLLTISEFAPNKPELFIECAKKYADCFGNVLFSSDYKELKKVLSFKQELEKFVITKQ